MSSTGTRLSICETFYKNILANVCFRSCRTHPGAVRDLSLCPGDTSKLLIVFEKGHVVLWNIPTREAERFAIDHSPAKCVSWHYDGRQFMCGHKDGSLTV